MRSKHKTTSISVGRHNGVKVCPSCALAKLYGYVDEELDFTISYDIKYRMGQENSDVGEGEE